MRLLTFAGRNFQEILRDPISAIFGLGFPMGLMAIMQVLFRSIPGMPEVFLINSFGPSMVVFGQTFLMLFLATLMTSDRLGAYLSRLFTTPMTGTDFIGGYALSLLPLALLQGIVCLALAIAFGMRLGRNLPLVLVAILVDMVMFVAIGLLVGSLFHSVQLTSGMCSLLINVVTWLSGMWFPLELVGGAFQSVCRLLPFYHAVQLMKGAVAGTMQWTSLIWVLGYAAVIVIAAVAAFRRRMRGA